MNKFVTTGGAALLALLSAGPALAADRPPLVIGQSAVPHGDLDLATPAGAETMLARLEAGAARACGGRPASASSADALGEARRREYRRCRIAAVDVATIELEAPLVRAAWLERDEAAHAAAARRDAAELFMEAGLDVPAGLLGG